MKQQRVVEIFVGLFVLLAIIALLILTLRVSGLNHIDKTNSYQITAEFDNIGSLKVGAPVRVAGVKIGQVVDISLDQETFRARAQFQIFSNKTQLPQDTAASIQTSGILGSQYVSLTPGFSEQGLKNHSVIQITHPALVLENLIGQLVFNLKKGNSK